MINDKKEAADSIASGAAKTLNPTDNKQSGIEMQADFLHEGTARLLADVMKQNVAVLAMPETHCGEMTAICMRAIGTADGEWEGEYTGNGTVARFPFRGRNYILKIEVEP